MVKCSTCDAEIEGLIAFRDELSFREFLISGCCQGCQDEVFCDRYTGAVTCDKPCCKDEGEDTV